MSMILFACVVRVRDGLPLSASSDFHLDPRFLECRKRLKVLSSILTQYPERGTAKECDLSIHFHTSGGVACTCIAISSYPAVMAFCFLEELRCKFATSYNATSVSLASRPYAFLEFAPACRMQPVSPLGILSLVLNIMCGALNLIRGVHLAEYSLQEDHQEIGNIIAFLLPFMCCFGLCYLYLFYTSARKIKVFILLATVCLCNVYLYGLRNNWQILFHIAVASFSSHQILTRQVAEKQPDLGV
ncbi:vesicle-trafficking protein SEC22c isoform X2 [Crotalus tigris]|uniref:vesicle-trafficking protein SEC22c isoform X2 n=1 Tax=Crotalus tigris TaxID=88082 RepID=UPI00192F81A5|nr:vesicle-trafficking protein SEC22c isoform X2 [Crotalus tigris]